MQAFFTCIYLHSSPMMLSKVGGQYLGPCHQVSGPWDQPTLIRKGCNQNMKCCVSIVNKINGIWMMHPQEK